MSIKKLTTLFISLLIVFAVAGCAEKTTSKGYDGRVFDISENGDGSLTVKSEKDGNNYKLTIEGSGKAVDYGKKELVPWNIISKKVTTVSIADGIENIGDFYFYSMNLESVTLPATVKSVGASSFNSDTVLYSFSETEFETANKIYYYSETKKSEDDKYFYIDNGEIRIWKSYSFLFIGNSFTFRQGSEENPMVPYLFGKIADNMNISVNVDAVVKSSCTLTKYANDSDEMGAIVNRKLNSAQYDFIILQEQSTTPLNSYNSFNEAVKALVNKIERTQNNATVYLYETWGSPTGIQGTSYKTVTEMTEALAAAYGRCASENRLPVTHVGTAFSYVFDNHSEIEIFADDNRHQSNIGAYLSACCHIRSMLGADPRTCTYYGDNGIFGESVCKILQSVAYDLAK